MCNKLDAAHRDLDLNRNLNLEQTLELWENNNTITTTSLYMDDNDNGNVTNDDDDDNDDYAAAAAGNTSDACDASDAEYNNGHVGERMSFCSFIC